MKTSFRKFQRSTFIVLAGIAVFSAIAQTEPTVTNKFYSSAGKWIQASNTNCVLWSSFPKKGESVTWAGGILDGKAHGKGLVQWFTNGVPTTSYSGEMKGGLSDGHGIVKAANERYEGDWRNGKLITTNGTIEYRVGWYKGQIKDGYKTGHGEESMEGGIRYIGQFRNDRFHGKGEMIWPNGNKITGEWRNSKIEGIGTYQIKDGESFEVEQTAKGIERHEP